MSAVARGAASAFVLLLLVEPRLEAPLVDLSFFSRRGFVLGVIIGSLSMFSMMTLLLYFNAGWGHEGGRLRMLNSATDLEDYAAEVTPCCGTLLVFKRTGHSWHGHKPFVGERRMLQLSWTRGGDFGRYVSGLTKPVRRLLNMS